MPLRKYCGAEKRAADNRARSGGSRAYDAMLRCFRRALKPTGRLVIIEPEAKPGRPRADYKEEHVIPAEIVKADAVRNGFQIVARHADVITPDRHHWSFLVFAQRRSTVVP